jgi:hypothetical protein
MCVCVCVRRTAAPRHVLAAGDVASSVCMHCAVAKLLLLYHQRVQVSLCVGQQKLGHCGFCCARRHRTYGRIHAPSVDKCHKFRS